MLTHNLGFPRIGKKRELKRALEAYWQGDISEQELLTEGARLRSEHWKLQADSGIDLLPAGDFAWYDHVLTTSLLLGAVPERHRNDDNSIDLDTLFRVARGRARKGKPAAASDMTKWFNTNYHYIVPEFTENQQFAITDLFWFEQLTEARKAGYQVKPVLLGPVTYLYLGKALNPTSDKLSLLPQLLNAYQAIFDKLNEQGIEWLQLDEPILSLELPSDWLNAITTSYHKLNKGKLKLLLASYFGDISQHLPQLSELPLDGIHIDVVAEKTNLQIASDLIPANWVLSAGIINGRNIWRSNLVSVYQQLLPVYQQRKNLLWLAPSCSLLHSPVDLTLETTLDTESRSWFAFARQKCEELALLKQAILTGQTDRITQYSKPVQDRKYSAKVQNLQVQQKVAALSGDGYRPISFTERQQVQRSHFNLPLLPTTTIGSFPQTPEIRQTRLAFNTGKIDTATYETQIKQQIQLAVLEQDQIGLDVLVHGEAERNDMVEYFGQQLDGFVFTQYGWVQSYGSRCVKPPIIVGDISRPEAITIEWTRYAQSLTSKPMKGMLTGPVTILGWSFPREDISRKNIALQLSLALAEEVQDLEQAGIDIIQIDEPAFREGLPLKRSQWHEYLDWAAYSFRLCSTGVKNTTQIHTHMCYSEFNDVIESIAAMDADVITIETSRSNMELLNAFEDFAYPNQIGPGVYDIHSPNIPTVSWIKQLIHKAANKIPVDRLWVNPDCGLKTRGWNETRTALTNMVKACKELRQELA